MTEQHPIIPSLELYQQWCSCGNVTEALNSAAQWGADQELDACCEWLAEDHPYVRDDLRAARRPKPPSLAEEALMALEDGDTCPGASLTSTEVCVIRRALERLQELEGGQ